MNSQSGPQGGYGVPQGYLIPPFYHAVSNNHQDGMAYQPMPIWPYPIQPNVGNPQWPSAMPGPPTPGGPTSEGGW